VTNAETAVPTDAAEVARGLLLSFVFQLV